MCYNRGGLDRGVVFQSIAKSRWPNSLAKQTFRCGMASQGSQVQVAHARAAALIFRGPHHGGHVRIQRIRSQCGKERSPRREPKCRGGDRGIVCVGWSLQCTGLESISFAPCLPTPFALIFEETSPLGGIFDIGRGPSWKPRNDKRSIPAPPPGRFQ